MYKLKINEGLILVFLMNRRFNIYLRKSLYRITVYIFRRRKLSPGLGIYIIRTETKRFYKPIRSNEKHVSHRIIIIKMCRDLKVFANKIGLNLK